MIKKRSISLSGSAYQKKKKKGAIKKGKEASVQADLIHSNKIKLQANNCSSQETNLISLLISASHPMCTLVLILNVPLVSPLTCASGTLVSLTNTVPIIGPLLCFFSKYTSGM